MLPAEQDERRSNGGAMVGFGVPLAVQVDGTEFVIITQS
jgi:hypothetical protein